MERRGVRVPVWLCDEVARAPQVQVVAAHDVVRRVPDFGAQFGPAGRVLATGAGQAVLTPRLGYALWSAAMAHAGLFAERPVRILDRLPGPVVRWLGEQSEGAVELFCELTVGSFDVIAGLLGAGHVPLPATTAEEFALRIVADRAGDQVYDPDGMVDPVWDRLIDLGETVEALERLVAVLMDGSAVELLFDPAADGIEFDTRGGSDLHPLAWFAPHPHRRLAVVDPWVAC